MSRLTGVHPGQGRGIDNNDEPLGRFSDQPAVPEILHRKGFTIENRPDRAPPAPGVKQLGGLGGHFEFRNEQTSNRSADAQIQNNKRHLGGH